MEVFKHIAVAVLIMVIVVLAVVVWSGLRTAEYCTYSRHSCVEHYIYYGRPME